MGCAPSTLNNNLRDGSSKPCTCECHKNSKTSATSVRPASSSRNGSQLPALTSRQDQRISLSERQIFLIKRSWKGISRNMSETGINMFLNLFERNADLLKFFTGLQSYQTLSDLRSSSVLENHVKGVMMTIDEAITNLDDADYCVDMLLMVGKTHTRFTGYDPKYFLLLKEPFLLATKETLGDRFTAHVHEIYEKAIDFILNTLVTGFGLASDPSAPKPDLKLQELSDGRDKKESNGHHAATLGKDRADNGNLVEE